jgi:hypothetical protein
MKLQKSVLSLLTLSIVAGSLVFAQSRPDPFPDRGNGGGGRGGEGRRPPGPVRPDRPDDRGRGDNCPGGRRSDGRCDDGRRDDGRWDSGRRDDGRRDDRWGRNDGRRDDGHRNDHGPYYPRPRPPYQPPYEPVPPVYNPPGGQYESNIILNDITRRAGGEWRRINLNYPVRVDYIKVQAFSVPAVLHETYILTRNGARYGIRSLSGVNVNGGIASEMLNVYDDVIAIDVRAESMGGYADLSVSVVSSNGATSLSEGRY